MKTFLPLFVCITMASFEAAAQIIAYDGFESYAAGTQVESGANGAGGAGLNGGFGWGGAYDVNDAFKTLVTVDDRTAFPLVYNNGAISIDGGVRALKVADAANGSALLTRPLGSILDINTTVYVSFLFRTNNTSPLNGQDFLQLGFDSSTAGGNPRVSIGANTTSSTGTQPFRFFARTTVTATNSTFYSGADIQGSTTYFLVGRISGTSGNFSKVDLFVNPDSFTEPTPSATFTLDSGISTLAHLMIRTASLDAGDVYLVDELRVGGSYLSVVPEPGSAAALLAGGFLLGMRRRNTVRLVRVGHGA